MSGELLFPAAALYADGPRRQMRTCISCTDAHCAAVFPYVETCAIGLDMVPWVLHANRGIGLYSRRAYRAGFFMGSRRW